MLSTQSRSPEVVVARPARRSVGARQDLLRALTFAAASVALGAVALIAGVSSSLLPFVLALGPTVIAIAFAWREGDGALRRLLRLAVTRPRRRAWYLLVALPLVWALATILVAVALGSPTGGLFDKVVPAIVIVPLVVLLPAFAEEIAWRGYAVTRLLPSMSPVLAALVLAGPWTLLHIFLQLPGQMNAGLAVWPTVLSLVAYSVILTWVFVRSGGSVLLTALIHAGFNGVVPLMGGLDADRAWAVRAVLVAVAATAVVIHEGAPSWRRATVDESVDADG
jgi:uncharacterized protein